MKFLDNCSSVYLMKDREYNTVVIIDDFGDAVRIMVTPDIVHVFPQSHDWLDKHVENERRFIKETIELGDKIDFTEFAQCLTLVCEAFSE